MCPYISDLVTLVNKDIGLCQSLIENLDKLGIIKLIILSKPFLYGRLPGPSEVDLLVVGKPNQDKLAEIIKDEEKRLGREINYSVFTEAEFDFRKGRKDPFVVNILLAPRIVVFGDELKYAQAKI